MLFECCAFDGYATLALCRKVKGTVPKVQITIRDPCPRGIPTSPPVHKFMGFFMYPQDNIAVDYEELEKQDRQLQRLHLEQLHLPGLKFSDDSKDEGPLPQKLNKEVESATKDIYMPTSFYQHLPDWDKQNMLQTGNVLYSVRKESFLLAFVRMCQILPYVYKMPIPFK